jgi:hypothetical protein
MAEGRGRFEWGRTSSLMALVANAHRDPKRHRPYRPKDFDPYRCDEPEKPTAKLKDLSILKAIFVENQQASGHGRSVASS